MTEQPEFILECPMTQEEASRISDICIRGVNGRFRTLRVFSHADLRDLALTEIRATTVAIGLRAPEIVLPVAGAMFALQLFQKMQDDRAGQQSGTGRVTIRTQFTRDELTSFLNALSTPPGPGLANSQN